jgi:hypothetical protein
MFPECAMWLVQLLVQADVMYHGGLIGLIRSAIWFQRVQHWA